MIELLQKAVSEIVRLPEPAQREAAEGLLAWLDLIRREQPLLTADEIAGVEAARAEARAGRFATDEELAAMWRDFDS